MLRSIRPVVAAFAVVVLAGCASSQGPGPGDATMSASREWRLAKLEETAMAQHNAQLELANQLNAVEDRLDEIDRTLDAARSGPAPLMSSKDLPEPGPVEPAPDTPDGARGDGMAAEKPAGGDQWDDYPDATTSGGKTSTEEAGSMKAAPDESADKPAEKPARKSAPKSSMKSTAKAPAGKAQYDRALKLVLDGKTAKARPLFQSYLKAHPEGGLAPNAQYWLGETYYHEKRYAESVVSFKKVHQQFPRHDKAAAALLKIGYAYDMLGDKDNARFYLEVLTQDYPDTDPARLARKRLASLD